jgi:hypothetical protein
MSTLASSESIDLGRESGVVLDSLYTITKKPSLVGCFDHQQDRRDPEGMLSWLDQVDIWPRMGRPKVGTFRLPSTAATKFAHVV